MTIDPRQYVQIFLTKEEPELQNAVEQLTVIANILAKNYPEEKKDLDVKLLYYLLIAFMEKTDLDQCELHTESLRKFLCFFDNNYFDERLSEYFGELDQEDLENIVANFYKAEIPEKLKEMIIEPDHRLDHF